MGISRGCQQIRSAGSGVLALSPFPPAPGHCAPLQSAVCCCSPPPGCVCPAVTACPTCRARAQHCRLPLRARVCWNGQAQWPLTAGKHGMQVSSEVTVTNMRGIYDEELSIHMLTLMLALNRQLDTYHVQQLAHEYTKLPSGGNNPASGRTRAGVDIPSSTALLVGVGNAGGETARLCKVGRRPPPSPPPPVLSPLPYLSFPPFCSLRSASSALCSLISSLLSSLCSLPLLSSLC